MADSAVPAADFAGALGDSAEALAALVRRRVESRYRRILFVHRELAKLDAEAQRAKKAAAPTAAPRGETPEDAVSLPGGGSFEDFVFSRIDFSVYKKIDAEEFRLLFDEGLDDYDEPFYQKAFGRGRENVRRIITGSYIKVGSFYVCKNAGPLVLSIMRTLHTSLEFAPLLRPADVAAAGSANVSSVNAALDEQIRTVAAALDGIVIRHGDGAETRLFVPQDGPHDTDSAHGGEQKTAPGAALRAVFYPLGKAYTVTVIP